MSTEEIIAAGTEADGYADTLRRLGLRLSGNNHRLLKELLAESGVSLDHFLGPSWVRVLGPNGRARPLAAVLVEGSRSYGTWLKDRLLREGVLSRYCAMCEVDTWNGQPVSLELGHINGVNDDNRLENLRLLCPNCHAQTPTYRGRNIGRGRVETQAPVSQMANEASPRTAEVGAGRTGDLADP